MKAKVKITKTNTYIKFDGKLYFKKSGYPVKEMTEEDKKVKTGHKDIYGWIDVDANSVDEALEIVFTNKKAERKQRSEEYRQWKEEHEKELYSKWEELEKLEVIPSTLDNIRILLEVLNRQNWGGWILPKMSIGYSCNQYDCDGKIATTIILDEPVNGKNKYKVGGKRGHLNKYYEL